MRFGTLAACIVTGLTASAITSLANSDRDEMVALVLAQHQGSSTTFTPQPRGLAGARAYNAQLIASEARRQGIDPNVALRIAKVESGFRADAVGPRTRHGRAQGLLQLLPSSAEALEPGSSRRLLDPEVNARVGVRHMVRCREAGAASASAMAACHVAGWGGWNRKLSRHASRYRARYVQMVASANVPDQNGWLARNTVSVASLN